MQRLGEDFIKAMGLEDATEAQQATACEMLRLVLIEKHRNLAADICYPDKFIENGQPGLLVQLLGLAGSWSNDLASNLVEDLINKGIDSALIIRDNNGDVCQGKEANPYKAIWKWLDDQGIDY